MAVINLDPANDVLPYECAVNIEDLIKLEDAMNQYGLGPNGGKSSALQISLKYIILFILNAVYFCM